MPAFALTVYLTLRRLQSSNSPAAPSPPNRQAQAQAQDQDQAQDPYAGAIEFVRRILDDQTPTAAISPSGELYRAIARSRETEYRVRRNTTAASPDPVTAMSTGSDRELRRRFNRDPQTGASHSPPPVPPTLPSISNLLPRPASYAPSLPPLRSLVSRRTPTMFISGPSTSRLGRHRPSEAHMLDRRGSYDFRRPSSSFQEMTGDLANANSHLEALLDYTDLSMSPTVAQSSGSPTPHSQDHTEENRRVKRRKVERDGLAPTFSGFNYDYYGQVEPGPLQMELVSCDGGSYSPDSHAPNNILKNDNTVYCTKGSRCNIVIRHQGATVFNLSELTIKAPVSSGFSYPVREGMVFASMNNDEVLRRTAQYQIQYLPPGRNTSPSVLEPAVISVHHDEERNVRAHVHPQSSRRLNVFEDNEELAVDETRPAVIPAEFSVSPPPYNITTTSERSDGDEDEDDRDDDADDPLSWPPYPRDLGRAPPNRIGSLPFEGDGNSDGGDPWLAGFEARQQADELTSARTAWTPPVRARDQRRNSSSRAAEVSSALAEAREASQLATQEALRAVGGEMMAPLLHFYIERRKSKCVIRFDPPISARFILLKIWSPHHSPNASIDIQGVFVKGFAGPRFLPSVEMV